MSAWLEHSARFARELKMREEKAMTLKQLAAEIYAMRSSKRKAEVDKLPEGDRVVVWGYIDQLGNQAKADCRRRNTLNMGKKSPRNKPGRPA